jgi:hypothetical protein
VLELGDELGIELARIDQFQQSALGIGVGDDGLCRNLFPAR